MKKIAFCLISMLSSLCGQAPIANAQANPLEQSWWLKYQQAAPKLSGQGSAQGQKQNAPQVQGSAQSQAALQGTVSTSTNTFKANSPNYFVVPPYFSSQPAPYVRPTEIILPKSSGNSSGINPGYFAAGPALGFGLPYYGYGYGYPYNPGVALGAAAGLFGSGAFGGETGVDAGMNAFKATLPMTLSGGNFYGAYGPWGGGFFPGYGPGTLGGFAGGYPGYGFGYSGYSMGMGAIFMGAFGNSMNSSNLGKVTPSAVIQTAPSKASGNYYQPSNVDTTAAGSYYATQGPAMTPVVPQNQAPTSFWGDSGSPLPKDLNKVPW